MNAVVRNNIVFYYESYWRKSKNDNWRDSVGKKFPFPREFSGSIWINKDNFISKLMGTQNYLKTKGKYITIKNRNPDCLLCDTKNINRYEFNLNNNIWENGLIHYIEKHGLRPSDIFVDLIFTFNPSKKNSNIIKIKSKLYSIGNFKHVKVERNQLMILDALMAHGGYSRKYVDANNNKVYRFSEHFGLMDFGEKGLDKIIISGNTNRVDKGDEDIFQPIEVPDAINYEYFFHTHPPTPKPGGRVNIGILYEFPSPSDIFHFIYHYNEGKTQGSIVVTPEGLYNIRKQIFDRKMINIDENKLYSEISQIMRKAQSDAIKKYEVNFGTYDFFSIIAQDKTYINMLNVVLNKFLLHIDYFPRVRDNKGKWILDKVYLPIYVVQTKRKK